MQTFTIEPNVGPAPLRFGMTAKDVAKILGPPAEVFETSFGLEAGRWPHFSVGYDDHGRVMDIVFLPGTKVLFAKHDLFIEPDPIGFLRRFDKPYLAAGFVVFLNLGIRISGFLPDDEEPKVVEVFQQGQFDEYLELFKPL